MVTKGEMMEGAVNWEIGIDIYTLLYIYLIVTKDLQYEAS